MPVVDAGLQVVAIPAARCRDQQRRLDIRGTRHRAAAVDGEARRARHHLIEAQVLDEEALHQDAHRQPDGRGGLLVPRRQTPQDQGAGGQGLDRGLTAQQLQRGQVEARVLGHQPGAVPIVQFQALDARPPGQSAAQAGQDHPAAAQLAQAPGNEPLSGARIGEQQQGPRQQDRQQQEGQEVPKEATHGSVNGSGGLGLAPQPAASNPPCYPLKGQ